jgi:hypothetical protein
MRGAIPPLPDTSSWRGAYLSTGTTLPFTLLPVMSQISYLFAIDVISGFHVI